MGTDVSIVGAGLARLAAAQFLAERGKRILVIDKMSEPGSQLLGQLHHVGGRDDELHDPGQWIGSAIAGIGRTDWP